MHNRSLDILKKPDHEDEPHVRSQHILKAEPSLSPWSSTADPNEFWPSEYDETFEPMSLGVSDCGSEAGMSYTSHDYGDIDLSELSDWNYDIKEMERGNQDTVPGHGALPPGPIDSQTVQGDLSLEAFHAPLESPNSTALYPQAKERSPEPFEKIGAQFMPGSSTDHERPTNHMSFPLPRVVVSDTAIDNGIDNIGAGKRYAPELSTTTSSNTAHFDGKQDLGQDLKDSMASSGSRRQQQDVNLYRPNNYEVAMYDRQPPNTIIGGIEPKLRSLAAKTVNAFCTDADSTIPIVAAVSSIDEGFGVKRRRLPANLPMLQIPYKTPPGLQRWPNSSGIAVHHSTSPNTLKPPNYPTPPSSFGGTAEYHLLDAVYGREKPLSEPTTPCLSQVEPPSPVSPSPSSVSDSADGVTRCRSCPDKIFTGTRENQKNSLQRHNRDVHDGMARLECLVQGCTASFAPGRKDNRMKHVRAMHPYYSLPAPSTKGKRKANRVTLS